MTRETKKLIATFAGVGAIAALGIALLMIANPQSPKNGANQNLLVAAGSHSLGDPNAKVTIVEFSDFQCPACQAAWPVTQRILGKYQGQLRFVYRNFPLNQHINAVPAARAAWAAGEQGKYWEMADLLFARQTVWSKEADPSPTFAQYAKELRLNEAKFAESYKAQSTLDGIKADADDGLKLGIDQTPTFFINGIRFPGVPGKDFEDFLASKLRN